MPWVNAKNRVTLNPDLSVKIQALRGAALVLVVFAHSLSPDFRFAGERFDPPDVPLLSLQHLVAAALAKAGVPLFAFISGFLFFRETGTARTWRWFLDQGRRRVRSLLVPYLVWSALALTVCLVAQQWAWTSPYVTRAWVDGYGLGEILYRLLWMPVAYPLWFVRDLMLTVLIAPLLLWGILRLGVWFPVAWLIYWLFTPSAIDPTRPWLDLRCPTFFTLGAYFAVRSPQIPSWWLGFRHGLMVAWIAAAVFHTLITDFWHLTSPFLLKQTILAGFAAIWLNYEAFGRSLVRPLTRLGRYSFFIFAAHEPLLTALRKTLFWLAGYNAWTIHLAFLLGPVVVISSLYLMAVQLERMAPGVYRLATGRRTSQPDGAGSPRPAAPGSDISGVGSATILPSPG